MRCKCRVVNGVAGEPERCHDTDIGDGGMCHFCSHVHTGLMTSAEYWAKWPYGVVNDEQVAVEPV